MPHFYRYLMRGLGIIVVAGILTILGLAIRSQLATTSATPATAKQVHTKH